MNRVSARAISIVSILVASVLAACSKPAEQPASTSASSPAPQASETAASTQSSAIVHPFTIGTYSAMALSDGDLEFPNDNKVFGIGHTRDEVSTLLTAAGLGTETIQLGLQPLYVKTPDRVLLFDTGAGTNFGPTAGHIARAISEAGIDPESVTDIFISHVHGDHVGGLTNADGVLVFPNATIHISEPEWTFLTTMNTDTAKAIGLSTRDALVAAMKPKVETFKPNAEIVPGVVRAVEIKGHTPGHSGYRIISGDESMLYIGDTMHHSVISVKKPEWLMGFDTDEKVGAVSRSGVDADLAKSGERFYAVHFPFPGIGRVEQRDGALIWVAE